MAALLATHGGRGLVLRRTIAACAMTLALGLFQHIPAASATVMNGTFAGTVTNGSDIGDFGGTVALPLSHDGAVVTGTFTIRYRRS